MANAKTTITGTVAYVSPTKKIGNTGQHTLQEIVVHYVDGTKDQFVPIQFFNNDSASDLTAGQEVTVEVIITGNKSKQDDNKAYANIKGIKII